MSLAEDLGFQSTQDEPQPSRVGILLIHGLTGAPAEMRPIARHLKKMGYRVETPLLAGHGAGHQELIATTWEDWLDSLRPALAELLKDCQQVFVGGLSMGALLATMLAAEEPRISGIMLLSVDFGFPGQNMPLTRYLLPFVYPFPALRRFFYWSEKPPYGLKDKRLQNVITRTIEASRRGETVQYGLFRTYVESIYQIEMLKTELLRRAPQVRCSVLIIHSLEDTMFGIRNASELYVKLSSASKKILKLITGCDHVMTVDLRKNEVAAEVGNFVASVADNTAPTWGSDDGFLNGEIYSYPTLNYSEGVGASSSLLSSSQSLIIRKGKMPVLFLPFFEVNRSLTDLLNGKSGKRGLLTSFRRFSAPRILGVGTIYYEVKGTNRMDIKLRQAAAEMASKVLRAIAESLSVDVIVLHYNSGKERIFLLRQFKPSKNLLTASV